MSGWFGGRILAMGSSDGGYLPIEETVLFRTFVEVGACCWELVCAWPRLAQDTLGKQLVRAVDSVGANLAEGDGRYGLSDSIHYVVIARSSAREAKYWINLALCRSLVGEDQAHEMLRKLDDASKSLSRLITSRRQRGKASSSVRESAAGYGLVEE